MDIQAICNSFSDEFFVANYFFIQERIWGQFHAKEIGPYKREALLQAARDRLEEIRRKGIIQVFIDVPPPIKRGELHDTYKEFMDDIGHGDTVQEIGKLPR